VAEKGTVLQSLAISHQQRQGTSTDHLNFNKKPRLATGVVNVSSGDRLKTNIFKKRSLGIASTDPSAGYSVGEYIFLWELSLTPENLTPENRILPN
jgi:hypothetical protein